MPSEPKPKKWKAARTFTYRHVRYQPGDPVTDRRAIAHLIGTDRITVDRPKPAPKPKPQPEPEN